MAGQVTAATLIASGVNKTEPDLLRYLLQRGKVKQVHMRNIKGGLNDFQEVYPDEGVIDFFKIMRIFRDEGYEGAFLPDHMPQHTGDPGKLQAYAFGYGYINALITAANSERFRSQVLLHVVGLPQK
jgi:mannonate dehydratase